MIFLIFIVGVFLPGVSSLFPDDHWVPVQLFNKNQPIPEAIWS